MGPLRILWRWLPSRRTVVLLAIAGLLLVAGATALLVAFVPIEADAGPCGDAKIEGMGAPGPDQTPKLLALQREGKFDLLLVEALLKPQRARLSEIEVLIVPGFLTDLLDPLEAIGVSDYLDAQVAALEPLVRRVSVIDLETEGSVQDNARTIEDAVAAADGPLCLLSHSKGGLDVLHFLVAAGDGDVAEKVVCWVAIQAPFAGSPVADFVADWWMLRWASEQLLLLFGGSEQALQDQTTGVRTCYLASYDGWLDLLNERLGVLALAGAIDGDASWTEHLTAVLPTLMWMRANGIRNDGLVPTASAMLPHLPFAVLSPLDHTGAVAKGSTSLSFDQRMLLTQALLALALEGR